MIYELKRFDIYQINNTIIIHAFFAGFLWSSSFTGTQNSSDFLSWIVRYTFLIIYDIVISRKQFHFNMMFTKKMSLQKSKHIKT